MANLPTIFTIQASDALQETARLRGILQNLENKGRISGFKILNADDDNLSFITENIREADLVLILLTRKLGAQKKQFENRIRDLKSRQPETRIAEIIVDNVIYDKEFITFPADLRPISNHGDKDSAWGSIEESLMELFPIEKKQKQEEQLGNKQLKAVENHPDYPELLKLKPGLAYLFGRYMFQIIFGLMFTAIAIFFITRPPVSDSFFGLAWVVGSFIFMVFGVGIIGFGIYRLFKLTFSHTKKLPALIVDKRLSVRGASSSSRTTYYVTLEFNDLDRQEVKSRGKIYGKITKDDVGVAYLRDRYLLDYRRLKQKILASNRR